MSLLGPAGGGTTTAADGQYSFAPLTADTWQVEPSKAGDFGAGVSSLDAAHVLEYVVGARSFDAMQQLACDVSGNGTMSTLDASRILQFAVGEVPRFPVAAKCGSDWAFLPSPAAAPNQRVTLPLVTAQSCRPGSITYAPLDGPAADQDFSAVLFGDCTGTWSSGAALSVGPSVSGPATVRLGRPRRVAGGRVAVPVHVMASAPFNALDLRVDYDPTQLLPVGVRKTRASAAAMVRSGVVPGRLSVGVASGTRIARRAGRLLRLEFATLGSRAPCSPLRAAGALVDDAPARVRAPVR